MIFSIEKKMNLTVIATVLVLLATACTPEQSTRKRSVSDGPYEVPKENVELKSSPEADRLNAMVMQATPIVTDQLGRNARDTNLLMQKVVIPFRDVVLDIDYLLNLKNRYARASNGRYVIPRMVNLFNEAVLIVYNENPQRILETDLLQRYKNMLLFDCWEEKDKLRGSCEYLKFFKGIDAANMTDIIKLMVKNESSDREQKKLILIAFEVKNNRLDGALRYMLLERLAENLVSKDSIKNMTMPERSREANFFANALKINAMSKDEGIQFKTILEKLNPWMMSRQKNDLTSPAMTEVIGLSSKELLYEDEKRKKLSSGMLEAIASLEHAVGRDYEQGMNFIVKNIRGEWAAQIKEVEEKLAANPDYDLADDIKDKADLEVLKGLLASPEKTELYGEESKNILKTVLNEKEVSFDKKNRDEYFYLVHQAYYGHYVLEDAVAFWNQTNKNKKRLLEEIEKLIKLQIANSIVFTNVRMNQFYENHDGSKIVDLLLESEKEASRVRKAWDKAMERSKSLKSLLTRAVNSELLSVEDRKVYNRITRSVDALRKNIKYLVTYPSMFPLLVMMAKAEMNETFKFWGRTITIQSNTVIKLFFNGYFFPWFNFNNDLVEFNTIELSYSYYYALVTQIFESYSTNSRINFSHTEFFAEVVQKLLLDTQTAMEETHDSLKTRQDSFKNNVPSIQAMCSEERSKQEQELKAAEEVLAPLRETLEAEGKTVDEIADVLAVEWYKVMRANSLRRYRVANDLTLDNLGDVYDGTSTRKQTAGAYLNLIYTSTNKKVFDAMRVDFEKSTMVARTTLDIYRFAGPGDAEEIDQIYADQFAEYYRLRANYAKIFFEMEEAVSGCDHIFRNRDRVIRNMLHMREVEYLGDIFDSVYALIKDKSEEEIDSLILNPTEEMDSKLEEVRQKFSVISMLESLNNPEYSQISKFPQEGYALRKGYNQINLKEMKSFVMDTNVRTMYYYEEMFPKQYSVTLPKDFTEKKYYDESNPNLIKFNWAGKDSWGEKELAQAREDFVASGMKAVALQINWAKVPTKYTSFQTKGDLLISMFKLGNISLNTDVDCDSDKITAENKKMWCRKITARDVLDHFKAQIHFVNIDDVDRKILNYKDQDYKYDNGIHETFIKKVKEHELYSIYDLVFKQVFSDEGPKGGEKAWFTENLIMYANTTSTIRGSTFIVPYTDKEGNNRINSIYRKYYNNWLDTYFELNQEFLAEVIRELDEGGMEPFVYYYEKDRPFVLGGETNEESQNSSIRLEPLISDLMFGKMDGLTKTMSNETVGYFSSIIQGHRKKYRELVK